MRLEKRGIAGWVVIGILTCGIGFLVWWFLVGQDIRTIRSAYAPGSGPVEKPNVVLDFILILVTCGLYGFYVDWQWAQYINEAKEQAGMQSDPNLPAICLILDFLTGWTVSTILMQSEINKFAEDQRNATS